MFTEINSAIKFLVNELAQKLGEFPEETSETLKKSLREHLIERIDGHWYPNKPIKGSAYRCLNISIDDGSVDSVLLKAGEEIGITKSGMMAVFPKGLALWIDPNDVSCRLGKGAIFPIFRKIAEQKSARPTPNVAPLNGQRRPQQRPRSISPPLSSTNQYNSFQPQQLTRPRSTTPPGFTKANAGQMYQQTVKKNHSLDNLHKLWDTIPNTTSYVPSTSIYQAPAVSTARHYHGQQQQKRPDTVYSFNQYSTFYNSTSMKKKYNNSSSNYNTAAYYKQQQQQQQQKQQQQKQMWQDDDTYNKYHWSRSERNASPVNAFNSYSSYSRHAQEVC